TRVSKKNTVKNVRVAAAQVVVDVTKHGRSLAEVLPAAQKNIAEQDAALLAELCYGTLRCYFELEALAAQLLQKPPRDKDADIHALLLLSFYQLRYMRVAEHAAVNLAVDACRALKKEWAGKLLNGVLRSYLRQREKLDAAIAQHHNHPDWLVRNIEQVWPAQALEIFAANNARGGMTLRVNRQRKNIDNYCAVLNEAGIVGVRSAMAPDAVLLEQAVNVNALPGFFDGDCSVQDVAAQLCAPLLRLQAGQRVLDACCAPGGKTSHILETEPQLAELVAIDNDEKRLQRVRDNLERLQFSATVLCADAAQWHSEKLFDRILLDAPCSGTGVIRRHPDIKHLRRESDIAALAVRQRELLEAMWRLLKAGGVLLYTTCSILPQENEQVIDDFLAQHTDAEIDAIDVNWGLATQSGRQLLPAADHDGFFFARLKKRA
ncbi:MAG TPA: 16S rRNA (cytosine(967)-C(5))-methyltransferase RsmB, partial [Pseudomonadales bacterium]|nr:16S rRNA (cytosine(967)-C(5))-methyltransferase RsmB [Pseudomonadales bacterium]